MYYESPTGSGSGETKFDFKTLDSGLKDGIFTFKFKEPVFYDSRMKVLCILAKRYSLSYENLYSADGLNCDEALVPKTVINFHKRREGIPVPEDLLPLSGTNSTTTGTSATTGTTLASSTTAAATPGARRLRRMRILRVLEERILLEESVNITMSQMDVFVFSSRRKGQNTDSYNKISLSTQSTGALNLFSFYLNGIANLKELSVLAEFDASKLPLISGAPSVKYFNSTLNVTGLEMNG